LPVDWFQRPVLEQIFYSAQGRAAADVGVEAVGEGAGEFAGQVAREGSLAKASLGEAVFEGLTSLGQSVGTVAAGASFRKVLSPKTSEAAEQVLSEAEKAVRTVSQVEAIQKMGEATKSSKVAERVPEKIEELVGDKSSVYFQTDEWDAYFKTQNRSPIQAVEDILGEDGVRLYTEAKQTGVPLEIPLGRYIAKASRTNDFEALLSIIRVEPDGPKITEATDALRSIPATMKELAEEAEAARGFEESARVVRSQMEERLKAAGFQPEEARRQAELYEARSRVRAELRGQAPEEVFRALNLQVTRGRFITAPESQVFEQPFQIDGTNIIDASDVFTGRQERVKEPSSQFDIDRFKARFGTDEKAARAVDRAQGKNRGPYVTNKNISGTGFTPNYLSEPTGVIGRPKLVHSVKFNQEPDPFAWLDNKWRASHRLLTLHKERGIPLEIHTSSDLIATEDYVNEIPQGSTVNIYYGPKDSSLMRILFPGNPSRARLEEAVSVLRENGIKVNEVQRTADEIIEDAGGIKYVAEALDLDEKEARARIQEDQATNIVRLFQEGPTEPRGQIVIGKGYINIELLKNANLSTFLHETAHVFFNAEMADDVAYLKSLPELNERQQRFLDDVDGLLEFVGADSLESLTREQSEKLAKGFEVYLLEGKAPSNRLKRAFASFRTWLLNVYRRMRPNVQLTDEVRGIFDRLIATEEEINAVRRDEAKEPMLRDPIAAGMTSAQAERYARVAEEAREASIITLTNEIVSEEKKKQEKEYKARRKEVMASVETEVNNMRLYRALATLGKGTLPDGSPLPEGTLPIKIDKKTLEAAYGKEFLKRLPRPAIYSIKDGIHYDMAANMLGFESGDLMLQEMANAPSREAMINRMTDERMKREYPELLESGAIEQAAVDAVHNDSQAELLKMDLQYLLDKHLSTVTNVVKRLTMRVPTDRQVRDQAEKIVGNLAVSQIKPFLYERAERKAAKEAGEAFARGDFEAAFIAKRKELLNHELYRTARRALLDYKNTVQRFKKLSRSDEDLSKTRDMDLVNAARSLLAQFGIGRFREDPESYLKNLKQYDADTYEAIRQIMDAALQNISNYRDLTYNDFSSLKDSVDALWSLSKSQMEMEIDGQKIEREVAIAEMAARIDALRGNKKEAKAYSQASSELQKVKMGLLNIVAALKRVEFWVDVLDGEKINGVFRKYIFTPVSDASTRYRLEKVDTLNQFLKLLEPIKQDLAKNNKDIISPELDHKFNNFSEVLGALLHTGNESNKSKLIRGWKWGAVNENGVLDSSKFDAFINRLMDEGVLQKRHFDFLQSVWDLFEKQKGEARKAHKAMYGYYFSEITSNEFTNRFGTYRGGYVPAKVDPFAAMDAQLRKDKEALDQFNNSFAFPTTGRGFTKSRVDKYAAPLTLDLRFIPAHLDWQLRFIHLEPKIKQVARIVNNRAFRDKVSEIDKEAIPGMVVPWLQRTAQQLVSRPSEGRGGQAADRFFRYVRGVSAMQIMFGHVVNVLQQFTGVSIAFLKVKPRYLRNALWEYIRSPKEVSRQIREASDFMRTRTGNQIFDISKNIEDIVLNPSKWDNAKDAASKHAYFLQSAAQSVVDSVVWIGAYNEATEKGLSEKESVRSADSAVRETQGSFNPEDISRIEAGPAWARLFTMLASFFNMLGNLLGSQIKIVLNSMGLKKGAGRLLYIYVFGFMIPAVLSEVIIRAMAGSFDEDDDDEYMDDIMSIFFGSQVRTLFAMAPGAGQVATAALNRFNDKWYDDRLSTSPAISLIEGAAGGPKALYNLFTEDEIKKEDVRDVFTLLGLMSGVPVLPFSRPISYLIDVESGDAEPTGPIDFTRGLITGRPGNQ
jgi:hypothetical protein